MAGNIDWRFSQLANLDGGPQCETRTPHSAQVGWKNCSALLYISRTRATFQADFHHVIGAVARGKWHYFIFRGTAGTFGCLVQPFVYINCCYFFLNVQFCAAKNRAGVCGFANSVTAPAVVCPGWTAHEKHPPAREVRKNAQSVMFLWTMIFVKILVVSRIHKKISICFVTDIYLQ